MKLWAWIAIGIAIAAIIGVAVYFIFFAPPAPLPYGGK